MFQSFTIGGTRVQCPGGRGRVLWVELTTVHELPVPLLLFRVSSLRSITLDTILTYIMTRLFWLMWLEVTVLNA